MQPKVFIIILNWNTWEDTLECLRSLRNNDYPNTKVVIVDNGSRVKPQLDEPDTIMLYNESNLGFAGGNNVGIRYALDHGADYILLLNNDTIVDGKFLSKLVNVGETDKSFGILGSKIYFYDDRDKIWSAGGKVNWLYNKGTMRGCGEQDNGQYDLPSAQETDFITGCCLLIKRQVIEQIGLIPEDYFLYYEDVDWSLNARRHGYKCIFVPEAKIWHKCSKSSVEGSSPYIYYHVRNGLMLAERFAPWHIKPFVHCDAYLRLKKQIMKWILIPSKRRWARYIMLGIKDFYFNKKGKNENWY